MTLRDLAEAVVSAEQRLHSIGYLSHLERGVASAPFFTYVAITHALGEQPGRMFGLDPVGPEPDSAERLLVHCLRRAGISPHEAMLRLIGGDPLHADRQPQTLDRNGLPSSGPVVAD